MTKNEKWEKFTAGKNYKNFSDQKLQFTYA
jgi:hypothetical protein